MSDFRFPKEWPPITNELEATVVRGIVDDLERELPPLPPESRVGAEIRRSLTAMRWRLKEWDDRGG